MYEDLTVHSDMSTKLVTLNLSTPSATIEEKMNNCDIMKKVDCNNVNCDELKFAYEPKVLHKKCNRMCL